MVIWWKKESANKIGEKDKNIGNLNGRINSIVQFASECPGHQN